MKDKKVKGLIITEAYNTSDLEAGVVCIVKINNVFYIVTLMHIDTNGDWFVTGEYEGLVERERFFFKLIVMSKEGNFNIAFKYWKHILKNENFSDIEKDFIVKPLKFIKGDYHRECINCSSDFTADKKQPYCKKCCVEFSTAHLKSIVKDKNQITINKPVTISEKMRDISIATYKLVKRNSNIRFKDFESWLDEHLENGNNSN